MMEKSESLEGSLSQKVVQENMTSSADVQCSQKVVQSVEQTVSESRKVTTAKFSSSQSFSSEEVHEYSEIEES